MVKRESSNFCRQIMWQAEVCKSWQYNTFYNTIYILFPYANNSTLKTSIKKIIWMLKECRKWRIIRLTHLVGHICSFPNKKNDSIFKILWHLKFTYQTYLPYISYFSLRLFNQVSPQNYWSERIILSDAEKKNKKVRYQEIYLDLCCSFLDIIFFTRNVRLFIIRKI